MRINTRNLNTSDREQLGGELTDASGDSDYSNSSDPNFNTDGTPSTPVPSPAPGSSCACNFTCNCGCTAECSVYAGSYDGYFIGDDGNYYFITQAMGSGTLTVDSETVLAYRIADTSYIRPIYAGSIDDLDSVNGYFCFEGSITYTSPTTEKEGTANWVGYIKGLTVMDYNGIYVVLLPNGLLPDINGWDRTSIYGTVSVDGFARNTYNRNSVGTITSDGPSVVYNKSTLSSVLGTDSSFSYLIFKLKKLPCGMDSTLLTTINIGSLWS